MKEFTPEKVERLSELTREMAMLEQQLEHARSLPPEEIRVRIEWPGQVHWHSPARIKMHSADIVRLLRVRAAQVVAQLRAEGMDVSVYENV